MNQRLKVLISVVVMITIAGCTGAILSETNELDHIEGVQSDGINSNVVLETHQDSIVENSFTMELENKGNDKSEKSVLYDGNDLLIHEETPEITTEKYYSGTTIETYANISEKEYKNTRQNSDGTKPVASSAGGEHLQMILDSGNFEYQGTQQFNGEDVSVISANEVQNTDRINDKIEGNVQFFETEVFINEDGIIVYSDTTIIVNTEGNSNTKTIDKETEMANIGQTQVSEPDWTNMADTQIDVEFTEGEIIVSPTSELDEELTVEIVTNNQIVSGKIDSNINQNNTLYVGSTNRSLVTSIDESLTTRGFSLDRISSDYEFRVTANENIIYRQSSDN